MRFGHEKGPPVSQGALKLANRALFRRHQFEHPLEEPRPARDPPNSLDRLNVGQLERRF